MLKVLVGLTIGIGLVMVVVYLTASNATTTPVGSESASLMPSSPSPSPQNPDTTEEVTWSGATVPMRIGTVAVAASVASTPAERMLGLSGTPFLPETIVKLFVFDEPGAHGIWMKDMNYPIDIAWVDAESTIVHLENGVDPSTFPNSFSSPIPALYVIETSAGFFKKNEITTGASVTLPEGL